MVSVISIFESYQRQRDNKISSLQTFIALVCRELGMEGGGAGGAEVAVYLSKVCHFHVRIILAATVSKQQRYH